MASPTIINTMTKYAQGIFQEKSNRIVEIIAPSVATGSANFTIPNYSKRSAFQVPNARRAIGGDSKAVVSEQGKIDVTLKPYALHDVIDEHEMVQASTAEGKMLLRKARIKNLISQAGNSRLNETLTQIRGEIAATPENWGANADPIKQLDQKILDIYRSSGVMPNKILMSMGAWIIFKNNAEVKKLFTASNPKRKDAVIMVSDVGALLLNQNIKVIVEDSIFDTPLNSPEDKDFALNSEVWIYNQSEDANMFDASSFKTFKIKDNAFSAVKAVEQNYGERWDVSWTEVPFVNNASSAMRLTITV